MKRSVAALILGLAVSTITNVSGQGAFRFSNYASPYVPIVYDFEGTGGGAVGPDSGVTIEVWWAPGHNAALSSLVFGAVANWSPFAGYTDPNQVFWIPEDEWVAAGRTSTWTAEFRASGVLDSWLFCGPLVNVNVAAQDVTDPETPPFNYTPGYDLKIAPLIPIPEPSTMALVGIGVTALMMTRRKSKQSGRVIT